MAIAFVRAATGAFSNPGSSQSVSLDCTGANGLVVGTVGVAGSDNVSGVTYAGVSMVKVGTVGPDRYVTLWYLDNPASGTNNIVGTPASSSYIEVVGACYSGMPSAAEVSSTASNGAASSLSCAVTTLTDNAWVVGVGMTQVGSIASSTDTTMRGTTGLLAGIFDSNGVVTPAGSRSLAITGASSNSMGLVVASFAPGVAASGFTAGATLGSVTASGSLVAIASRFDGGADLGAVTAGGSLAGASGTGTGATAAEIAAAVWAHPGAIDAIAAAVLAALQATAIPTDVVKVNHITIKGAGVPGNTWGPI